MPGMRLSKKTKRPPGLCFTREGGARCVPEGVGAYGYPGYIATTCLELTVESQVLALTMDQQRDDLWCRPPFLHPAMGKFGQPAT